MVNIFNWQRVILTFSFIICFFLYLEIKQTLVQLNKEQQPTINHSKNRIDSFINNAKIINYTDGKPQFILNTTRINYFANDNNAQLKHPILKIYTEQGKPDPSFYWLVTAKDASFFGETEQISLMDDVNITKKFADDNQVFIAKTDYLDIFPQKSYAKTDHPVTILTNKNNLTATGLNIDLIQEQYHLMNKVKYQETQAVQ